MGNDERVRRAHALEEIAKAMETHADTWTLEVRPGVGLTIVFDPRERPAYLVTDEELADAAEAPADGIPGEVEVDGALFPGHFDAGEFLIYDLPGERTEHPEIEQASALASQEPEG